MKDSPKTKGKRRVRRKALIQTDEGYRFAPNSGTLCVFSFREGRKKQVGIYGDPKGLRYLARLLNDIADIDQSKVPDINCPINDSVHFHLDDHSGRGRIHPKSENIILGRADSKAGGLREWLI